MAQKYIDLDVVRFLLFDVHHAMEVTKFSRYADYDRASMEVLLESVKSFADQELFPYFQEMDKKPVRFIDGEVMVHPQVERVLRKASEIGLFGPGFDYALGGMQLPGILYTTLWHIMDAANNHVTGYVGLTNGAANLIVSFGSQALIDKYVGPMVAGQWMGTMALTEPQAGSSLSDITTTAYPQPDGTYLVKGQKIFISGGDHQYSDNFVHLTLARIDGAPAGTKGISLFVVPKNRMGKDGSLVPNDLVTAGEFEKLGQKGYVTTHLIYGENDDCFGELVGEPHRGLKYMFQMMNEARISVGISAASMATAAYHASHEYALERKQGRPIQSSGKKDIRQEPIPIAEHPDVHRMLTLQRAITVGAVSLVLEAAKLQDIAHWAEGDEKEEAHLLLELLTPVAKTYPSEMGSVSISNGLQVLGGYGYTSDFILQQYYRDVRITAIYEGTTGIQSLDLLGRKIPLEQGRALQLLVKQIKDLITQAENYDDVKGCAKILDQKLNTTLAILEHLGEFAKVGDYQTYLADASIFMELFSTLCVGWQWVKIGLRAKHALVSNKLEFSTAFYEQQISTMQFYFKYEMPKISACAETLLQTEEVIIREQTSSE